MQNNKKCQNADPVMLTKNFTLKISAFYHLNGHRTRNETTHFNVLRCMFIKDDECVVCGF